MATIVSQLRQIPFRKAYSITLRSISIKYVSTAPSSTLGNPRFSDRGKSSPFRQSAASKRVIDRSAPKDDSKDDGSWSVIAYNLSEELQIDETKELFRNLPEYEIKSLPNDIQDEVVMMGLRSKPASKKVQPLNDIFLFREGSVVFWGVPYEQQKRILSSLSGLVVNPNDNQLVREEKEHMQYTLSSQGAASRLNGDVIEIGVDKDLTSRMIDQFAFSHAIALSVKLGIWEMMLDDYIESVEWVTENMKLGKGIKLTKDQVFRKTGEILCLKHSINLSSDLLDIPDLYWDRKEQEAIFSSLSNYLNIRKRVNVINEKLNNCCELMNLLAGHMNDRHHIRLEWMIIVLITVEVVFEFIRFYGPE